jgi:hypothetical protein
MRPGTTIVVLGLLLLILGAFVIRALSGGL